MEHDFLRNFPHRMKSVGAYALMFANSIQKQTWKKFGFETLDEQTNIIFSVLLFIMEQSLKEEACTMDDIGSFIDSINVGYFRKKLSYDECRTVGDFIVNTILCNEGRAMYFRAFDYEKSETAEINISFVTNTVLYMDGDVKRTSYKLTDDGYNLVLSTLEIEDNMKLTVQEMIFKLHLEKASYDKAAEDIRNIFNLLRIQLQSINDAMRRIRQNALGYSVAEYRKILEENIGIIEETKKKFLEYRSYVARLVSEMEQQNIQLEKLDIKHENNIKNLKIIEGYLDRSLNEEQRIFAGHYDLKFLYSKELESLTQLSLIKRFQINRDFYQKVLQDASSLDRLDFFVRPLLVDSPVKIYNPEKSAEIQRPVKEREPEEAEPMEDFNDAQWLKEQAALLEARLQRYNRCIAVILGKAVGNGGKIMLSELKNSLTSEEYADLFPTVEIFKEIMVELLSVREFDIEALRKEYEEHFSDRNQQFQAGRSILEIMEDGHGLKNIKTITVERTIPIEEVVFEGVRSELGAIKRIRCTNVLISAL